MSDPTRQQETSAEEAGATAAVTTDDTPAPGHAPAGELPAKAAETETTTAATMTAATTSGAATTAAGPAETTAIPAGKPKPKAVAEPGHVASGARHTPNEPFDEELPTLNPGSTSALSESQVKAGITRVECPICHTLWQGNDLRPHAAWFCTECQFPLFWVNSGIRTAEATTDDADARFPGTAGRDTLSWIDCPTCGELNPPDETKNCLRCGHPLTLPDPPPKQQPAAQIVVATPVIQPRRRIWPWIVATGTLGLIALILLIILIVND